VRAGGLGTLDAAFISLMTAFGASSSRALAADLIWRLMMYFLPIVPGVVIYAIWPPRRDRSRLGEATVATHGDDISATSVG
jgi:uncharacterized membrane protein YbhN (UPF0104 family)